MKPLRAPFLVAFIVAFALGLFAWSELDAQSSWRMPVKSGLTTGSLIYASSRSNLGAISAVAAGQALMSAGTGTVPAWTGSPSFSGNVTLGDAVTDAHGTVGTFYHRRKATSTSGAGPVVLTSADCGSVQFATATSGTTTYTLPSVTGLAGCEITFIAAHADGEILVNSAAAATCVVTTFGAVGADADTAIVTDASCNTGLKNTAATNAVGDTLTLVTDGTGWYGIGLTSGIWATQ